MTSATPRGWSLQRRLVVALAVLLALVSVVIGAVSVLALRENLVQRLDQQVAAELRFLERGGVQGEGSANAGQNNDTVGSRGSVRLVALGNVVVIAEFADDERVRRTLGLDHQAELLRVATGHAATVHLDDLGDFRVLAKESRGRLFVVGLSLGDVASTTANLILIFALVALGALAVAVVTGTWVVRLALRPLDRVVATATRVSEIPLATGRGVIGERVPEADTDPRTEVGQVGAALNRMLGHVENALVAREKSEAKVRQFVADASHELRTPLASIRGYSELTRRGGHEVPEDVARALSRIESESVRMTSLVEDLLLLARLDEGRELVVEEVDLGPLIVNAVSDAHAASPDHVWRVDATDEPVVVMGDSGRLHQVVANLLANARIHTPEGTEVAIGLSADDGHAVITVEDNGPGISEGLVPVLFERFARGDGSRSRATGSTGLGLAIVAALVDAHAGTVEVQSTPGETRFTVRLPLGR